MCGVRAGTGRCVANRPIHCCTSTAVPTLTVTEAYTRYHHSKCNSNTQDPRMSPELLFFLGCLYLLVTLLSTTYSFILQMYG